MQHLRSFVLSEGARYQQLTLASQDLEPRSIPNALADGLDGWSFLMRTPQARFRAGVLREPGAAAAAQGLYARASYRWTWFDPRSGEWRGSGRSKPTRKG